jgi:hypothetical protein
MAGSTVLPSADSDQERSADRKQQIAIDRKMLFWTQVIAGTAIAIGVLQGLLLLFQALYTGRAANAAVASAKTARSSMYLSLRARLGLRGITVKNFGPEREVLLDLEFRNFGGKGAMINDAYIVVLIAEPLPSKPVYPKHAWQAVGVPVEAGDSHYQFITISHFTGDEWNLITDEKGTARLIIYGVVMYSAGFGKEAKVGFCRFYDPGLSKLAGKPMFPSMTVKGYNYAD